MPRSRLLTAVGVVLFTTLSGCLNDSPVAPNASSVRLRLNAVIAKNEVAAAADRIVGVRVFYRSVVGGDAIAEVDLPSDPQQISAPSGTTTQHEITVQITPCLADPDRVGTPGCHFSVQLTLLDTDGGTLSTQTQDVDASSPGETVTVPKMTLQQAEIALSQNAITFTTQEQSATMPAASTVGITSVTGVSLGTVGVATVFGTGPTNWLKATLAADKSSVSIQPNTTTLAAGTYTATVTVSSSRASIAPKTINVTYTLSPKPQHLTVTGAGLGTGRVVSTPAGIDCSMTGEGPIGTCQADFPFGTVVSLAATPNANSDFAGYTGACTGTTCQVTMDQARTVAAAFQLEQFALTVTGAGNGNGTITASAAGINCTITAGTASGTCTASVPTGTLVTLTPTAAASSNFAGFSGACTGATCQITMDQVKSVVASFQLKKFVLTVAPTGDGVGTVTSNPSGINCTLNDGITGTCLASFDFGTQVTLTATPGNSWAFQGWVGDCSGTTCQLTMYAVHNVTAKFSGFFFDDFETARNWAATGLWNRINLTTSTVVNRLVPTYVSLAPNDQSAGRLPRANSGSFAFWYGNPNTGSYIGTQAPDDSAKSGGTSTGPNSGTLTSPAFSIPAGVNAATLSLAYWYEIEGVAALDYDIMRISVKDVATGAIAAIDSLNPTEPVDDPDDMPFSSAGNNMAPVWSTRQFDLSAYRGKTIQLLFTFDTKDEVFNGFRGWIIDDIVVDATPMPIFAASRLAPSFNRTQTTGAPRARGRHVPRSNP